MGLFSYLFYYKDKQYLKVVFYSYFLNKKGDRKYSYFLNKKGDR
jgi:hypothetical protein